MINLHRLKGRTNFRFLEAWRQDLSRYDLGELT